jgi:hypothetical protein
LAAHLVQAIRLWHSRSFSLAWVRALVFAAFGLFMRYLLPSENVMQILGPVLGILSLAGGLFVPVDQMGSVFHHRQVHPCVRSGRDRRATRSHTRGR